MRLRRAGPYATSLELDGPPSPATSLRLGRLRERLARSAPPEVRDVVPGFTSLLIEHRPTLTRRTSYAWPTRASPPAPSPSPPAVADPRDLWRLAQARAGDEVWLTGARVADARSEPLDFGP